MSDEQKKLKSSSHLSPTLKSAVVLITLRSFPGTGASGSVFRKLPRTQSSP